MELLPVHLSTQLYGINSFKMTREKDCQCEDRGAISVGEESEKKIHVS